ncbi:MAG: response regulator transcription factor [Bacteroidales bacterium]|nr:response regulator transcription factor [Bacteroidales bacterium]
METIKIVLIDDHKIIMDGISSLLVSEAGIEVIGQALNSDELFHILENRKADIVMLDIFLPKPIGIEILKSLVKKYAKIKVIILSGNNEEDLISNAFQAGASGYLTKNVEKDELIEAIQAVYHGEQYISRSLEKNLTRNFIKKATYGDKFAHHKLTGLTSREIEIIRLLSDGLGYKEIAALLDISTRTVETHKNNILEKLELKNTIELVKFAIKNKLIEL